MDEIKVTIVTCISNLGKTASAKTEVDTAVLRLKTPRLKAALVRMILRSHSGCFLPVTVVAELELNSVIPPPDMILEEDEKQKFC